jgi:hypothetical protein
MRTISGQEIQQCGIIAGVQYDPVSFILRHLQLRLGQLDDEMSLAAMTEFLAFSRHRNDDINQVLSRYEVARNRALVEGRLGVTIEGQSLMLLKALRFTKEHILTIPQPFGARLPSTEEQFTSMTQHLRRVCHILEHSPNNVGDAIAGQWHQAHSGAYWTDAGEDNPTEAQGSAPTSSIYNFPVDTSEYSQGASPSFWNNQQQHTRVRMASRRRRRCSDKRRRQQPFRNFIG